MPRMHCMGTSLEIPENGQICPKLPTNMVPSGQKCEIVCNSGTPNVEYIKCDIDGWSTKDVYCSGSSTGLIVGLLVGGLIVVCIIAYVYARMKQRRADKAEGKANNKSQPMSRAAKIAARNDMVVTGVVTREAVKTGVAKPVVARSAGKLVTGGPETPAYRHPSSSSQLSNPPSYHSYEGNEERSRNSTPTKSKGRRPRNSNSERSSSHHKQRQYFDEYHEEVDLGYHEGLHPSAPPMDDHYHHPTPDAGHVYPDYYGGQDSYPTHVAGNHRDHHGRQSRYGAMEANYYGRDGGQYPDGYLEGGIDNLAYSHGSAAYHKPYRVPI